MRFIPGDGCRLPTYEVADGGFVLSLSNENGDIAAFVRRPDGTHGHCYGGPVYDPPEFTNTCDRGDCWICDSDCVIADQLAAVSMSPSERRMADLLAGKVGWLS